VYAPGPRARAAHRGARRRAATGSRGRGGEEEEEGEEAPPTLTEARLTDPRSTDRSCPENRVVHIRRSHNRPTQVGNRRRERLTRARDDRARRCCYFCPGSAMALTNRAFQRGGCDRRGEISERDQQLRWAGCSRSSLRGHCVLA